MGFKALHCCFCTCSLHLSDQLHDLSQVFLLLQDLLGFGAQGHELGEVLVVVLVQGAGVLAVADEPVDGGEMLPLGQLLIQTPEHLRGGEENTGEVGEVAGEPLEQHQIETGVRLGPFTCTMPRVAEVTGSEKSPPGGDTLTHKKGGTANSTNCFVLLC